MLKLFRLLTKDAAAEVFAYLDSSVQQVIIEALTDTELKHIIDDLYLDDCVDMIEEMRLLQGFWAGVKAQMRII